MPAIWLSQRLSFFCRCCAGKSLLFRLLLTGDFQLFPKECVDAGSLVSSGYSSIGFCLGFLGGAYARYSIPPVGGRNGEAGRVLLADNLWGISALILLVTGGMRAFGGYEKGTDYYLHQPLFHLKMTLLVLILLIELAPMITLVKWRIASARGAALDTERAKLYARISHVEALLLVLMVIAATGMARGVTFV
ncbi:DUF2214 family protein [Pseudomonas sp. TH08]|uniref:DUF2214 family protein n=1 Tax=Pseudomonas sp. TH08 TaxID=2796374 RepID=UPI0019141190|nr:DUF2214 family protein [Pseudomonas sp. TH08]